MQVGDIVEDFSLPDQDGNSVRLSDFAGKTVVLFSSIHGPIRPDARLRPAAFSPSWLISSGCMAAVWWCSASLATR